MLSSVCFYLRMSGACCKLRDASGGSRGYRGKRAELKAAKPLAVPIKALEALGDSSYDLLCYFTSPIMSVGRG